MTYEETLKQIHDLSRFGSRLGLSRIERLLALLGDPQKDLKFIHVAGTNGKGSVCRYLYCALLAAGYRVGLYTSPFIEVFNERIESNGAMIGDDELAAFAEPVFEAVRRMTDAGEESPTEFEAVTAIAFLYFKAQADDYVVLEVGLGGRGDSTNVIEEPLASVITSISFDHMEYLGDTLPAIAAEKGGIIKAGAPVVYYIKDREAAETIRRMAEEKGSPCFDVGGTVSEPCAVVPKRQETLSGSRFSVRVLGRDHGEIAISMPGAHQVENACCALCTLEILRREKKLDITDQAIAEGFLRAVQIGRFEILREHPYLILDGAHNEDGAARLAETIKKQLSGKRILLICGILADKEVDKMISIFGETGAELAATEPDNPRKLSSEELCGRIRAAGYSCRDVGDYKGAVRCGRDHMAEFDAVIYAGSLYLVGRIREELRRQQLC